jgi:hypothetical protein
MANRSGSRAEAPHGRLLLPLCHPLIVPSGERTARFIEPMLLLRTDKLPEGDGWLYEVKFDGLSRVGHQERRAGPAPVP